MLDNSKNNSSFVNFNNYVRVESRGNLSGFVEDVDILRKNVSLFIKDDNRYNYYDVK